MSEFTGKYTPEYVERRLATPEYLLHAVINEVRPNRARINIFEKDGSKFYDGSVYYQGQSPTCLPWVIASGAKSLGIEPPSEPLAELLNVARDPNKPIGFLDKVTSRFLEERRTGITDSDAIKILSKYQTLPFTLAFNDRRLLPTSNFAPFLHHSISPYISSLEDRYNQWIVRRNANIIKQAVDNNARLLPSVLPQVGDNLHAVCLSGYIVKDAEMFVQFMDTRQGGGLVWVAIEDFSAWQTLNKTLLLSLNN